MKRILKQWTPLGPRPLRRALVPMVFVSLLLLGGQAMAAVYRMVGGECQDSNRPEVFYPDAGVAGLPGPGPKLCADQVFAEITLRDDYVPGTPFEYFSQLLQPPPDILVKSFSFTDGAKSASTTFSASDLSEPGFVRGVLPASLEPTLLQVHWGHGWSFDARSDGTWTYAEEFGTSDAPCGIGSIEGPNLTGLACLPTSEYVSTGIYRGWVRVPEPATLPLSALALAALAGLRNRRR